MTNEILDVCDTRRKKKPLSEEKVILKRWTEYCNELCNYPINPGSSVLQTSNTEQDKEMNYK